MNDYVASSTLGWLDLDTAASERVATLLRSLEEPSTLDVLGLGTVRDAFADMLSPGTSTVQTRLRYFIFLPWIFKRLEDDRVSAADFARRLRDHEARLIDCLRPLGSNQGVIGFRVGRDLRRMPSDIYWGGLGSWGIRKLDKSIAQDGQSASAPRSQLQRDDDGNATQRSVSMWAAGIPEPPEPFLWPTKQPSPPPEGRIDFDLLPDEAQFLTERIRHSQPDSLIAVLSARPGLSLDSIDYPWLVPEPELLPSRLAEVLHHARCFSELTLGPQLVYNLLLAREASQEFGWDTKELEDDQQGRLEDWSRLIKSRQGVLDQWAGHPEEFWQILAGYGISGTTRHFWNDLTQRVVNDPGRFAEDPMVHRLIRERERRLKSKRARLSYRAALENWHQGPVGGQLDYRWGITKTYLQDLAAAGGHH